MLWKGTDWQVPVGSTGVMPLKQQDMGNPAPHPNPARPSAFPLPALLPCKRVCD